MFNRDTGEVVGEGRPAESEDELRIFVVVPKDVGTKMSKAKFGVQVAHAALTAYVVCLKSHPEKAEKYMQVAQAKIVLQVKDEAELRELRLKAMQAGFPVAIITDAGRTEFDQPTTTALGIGPIWWKGESRELLGRYPIYRD